MSRYPSTGAPELAYGPAGDRRKSADEVARRLKSGREVMTWEAHDPWNEVLIVETSDPDGKRWEEALAYLLALGRCEG